MPVGVVITIMLMIVASVTVLSGAEGMAPCAPCWALQLDDGSTSKPLAMFVHSRHVCLTGGQQPLLAGEAAPVCCRIATGHYKAWLPSTSSRVPAPGTCCMYMYWQRSFSRGMRMRWCWHCDYLVRWTLPLTGQT